MKLETISQQKNPFLKRQELTIKIENEFPPSFEELKKQIGKDESLTVIKKINTNFGRKTFIAEAVIYDDTESKNKIETIPKKIRKKMEADEKAKKEAEAKQKEEAEKQIEETKPEETKPEETKNE